MIASFILSACCTFPTMEAPTASYQESPRKFSSPRSGGRLHAACDLYQSHKDQPVMAVEDGKVIRQLYAFYQGTYAIEVKHKSGFIVRYGEVTGRKPAGTRTGTTVKKGALIGYVGKVNSGCCEPMLHFERYKGTASGSLSQRNRAPYQRRKDLVDPTSALLAWEKSTFPAPTPLPFVADQVLPEGPAAPRAETKSFRNLVGIVKTHYLGGNPQNLVSDLRERMFKPRINIDHNRLSGQMTVVRSLAKNFSAHNFRAQYFQNDDGSDFVQHVSFVLRPGIKSMRETIRTVQSLMPLLNTPQYTAEDFIQWELAEGYVLWIKRLAEDDLIDDPFHKYTREDIGSLKIAIELNPED